MKKERIKRNAERCGVCFFMGNKALFVTNTTTDRDFDEKLKESIYYTNQKS